ncbi:MAG: POTRA domain-containing protein, partial [Ignavibacteriaceae bacterium]|nr:POTRA domain-containing protein [Ignavibacteriaceae bacterium]
MRIRWYNILFLLFSLLSLSINLKAQSGKTVIDSIKIIGNDITEDFIILRELSFKEKDAVDNRILKFNKERIFSLGLFTSVELNIEKFPKYNQLNIIVEEGWYIYPIPFISRSNQKKNSYSYGINVEIKNFRGRNEYLKGSTSFGYDPSFSVSYENPAFFFKDDLGMR